MVTSRYLRSGLLAFGLMLSTSTLGEAQSSASWDQQINTPQRFKVLRDFDDAAVLDQETGLVWERSPVVDKREWSHPFIGAVDRCFTQRLANRKGWRLPTIEELSSLVDVSVADPFNPDSPPALPDGHPFSNVQTDLYWSSTSDSAGRAYGINFNTGGSFVSGKLQDFHYWCVRGGQGHDGLLVE